MIRNYLKTGWRILWKNKAFSLINVLGLSVGITSCLIIGIYVLHELSYDRFFPNYNRIYRVVQEQEQAGDFYQVASTPAPLSEALKLNYPEVKETTTFSRIFSKQLFHYSDKSFEEGNGFHIDSSFFNFFNFPVLKGSLKEFFTASNSILLNEAMAHKYFGDEDPIGKMITINNNQNYVVAAIVEDPPSNSHFKFDFLLPMRNLRSYRDFSSWGNNWVYTYVLLNNESDYHTFESKIRDLLSDNIGNSDWQPKLYLQPLRKIHLHSDFDFNTDFADTGSLQGIYLFGAIGFIILLISCINFVNLTIAQSFQRNKETGIRKVSGANRKQLILRFLGEILIFIPISAMFAILLTWLLLPYFSNLSGLLFAFELTGAKYLLGLIFAILLVAGLLTGIFPSLFLSKFPAIKMFEKNSFSENKNGRFHLSSRKILVVSQFTLSVALIICAMMIRQQMQYLLKRDLGFEQEHILYTQVKGELANEIRFQSFKDALMQQSSIKQVTRSNGLPINHEGSFEGIEWEGMPSDHQDFLMNYFEVDENFVETFGLQILEGRNFLPRSPEDKMVFYIVNETALKTMQLKNPIGKRLEDGIIVGVVKDFNFQSAYQSIQPMILRSESEMHKNYISIRVAAGNMTEGINVFKNIYEQFNPNYPVEFQFLDKSIAMLYDRQIRSGKLINLFAALAIFISCLGLFGLATFTTQRRLKEIGIRKVNGAKTSEVITMLNKNFTMWVVIAFIIACPIAWYTMTKWLQNFAYKTELSWWIFALAGAIALVIALATVSFQSYKAANRNPVEALRYE